ncbi:MAG TPA: hypothetical protein VFI02_07255 [Armatimonadota bacterium]|nr:hypothetical protein [Armatimonadota bacterium]
MTSMKVDWAQRHEYVKRKLAAHHLQGLFEKLMPIIGTTLNGRWDILGLCDVGGQGLIWAAGDNTDGGKLAIVKMAFLPFHQQVSFGLTEIEAARRRIEHEATILRSFSGTILPQLYGLVYASNPLHLPQRGENVVANEPFIVMEFMQGETLDRRSRALYHHASPLYGRLEALALLAACELLSFFQSMFRNGEGYLYADLRPNNILVSEDTNHPIRLLDAGSVVSAHPQPGRIPPHSLAFLPPDHYADFSKGRHRWPTPSSVIYALGKTLHQVLTNREPIPGEHPSFIDPVLQCYSEQLVKCVDGMICSLYNDFDSWRSITEKLIRLRVVSGNAPSM